MSQVALLNIFGYLQNIQHLSRMQVNGDKRAHDGRGGPPQNSASYGDFCTLNLFVWIRVYIINLGLLPHVH